jgi:tRNA pseudouridine55 synthase
MHLWNKGSRSVAEVSGYLNINKQLHMSSHDVVARIKRGLKFKKVGHAGTLDPLATGVLVICVGNATRFSEYVMNSTKRYRARVHLGVTTETYDAEGAVLKERDASHIEQAEVAAQLGTFLGDIKQIPPMYSAIKQGGRKLYDLARAGETVEREARAVHIDSLDIIDWSPPEFTLDVVCGAGTYIRSLAYDLGEALGVGAHLSGLSRTASGMFRLDAAVMLDDLLSAEDWLHYLVPPQIALSDWPTVQLSADDTEHILHGRSIATDTITDKLALGYAEDGHLVAILRADGGWWRPHKVFSE